MTTTTLNHEKAQVDIEMTIPVGFTVYPRLAGLGYPYELGGIANVPIATGQNDEDGFPRIDLLPARGALLWLVVFDDRFEDDHTARSPRDNVTKESIASFAAGDVAVSRWDNVRMWARTEPLTSDKSLGLYAFVGTSPNAPTDTLPMMIDSLRVNA